MIREGGWKAACNGGCKRMVFNVTNVRNKDRRKARTGVRAGRLNGNYQGCGFVKWHLFRKNTLCVPSFCGEQVPPT